MRTPVRFGAVGLVNTAVGYGTMLALQLGVGWPPVAANAAGYAVGLAVSDVLDSSFTFAISRPHSETLAPFLGVAALSYALNLVALHFASQQLQWAPPAAQLLAVVSYNVSFYCLSRWFLFRSPQ